jgi:hypothetical protein
VRVYPDRLVIAAEGNILCEHARVIQRSHKLPPQTVYDWRHYLAVLQRKPGECLKLCVSDRVHAVFRYVQASKRPVNIMAS